MKWDQLKCDWLSVSQQIKLKWGKFTEEDLAMFPASVNLSSDLRATIRRRLGDGQRKVDAFVERLTLSPKRKKFLYWSQHCWDSIKRHTHVGRGI